MIVKGRIFADDPVIEWEVRSEEIYVGDGQGKELTINFHSKDIVNEDIFYTDANGLEMQERTVSYEDVNETVLIPTDISASFYPVTSAIAILDLEEESF